MSENEYFLGSAQVFEAIYGMFENFRKVFNRVEGVGR